MTENQREPGLLGVVLSPYKEGQDNCIIPHLIELKLKEHFPTIGEEITGEEVKIRFSAMLKSCCSDLRNPELNNGKRVFMLADALLTSAIYKIVNFELESIQDNVIYKVVGYEVVDTKKY